METHTDLPAIEIRRVTGDAPLIRHRLRRDASKAELPVPDYVLTMWVIQPHAAPASMEETEAEGRVARPGNEAHPVTCSAVTDTDDEKCPSRGVLRIAVEDNSTYLCGPHFNRHRDAIPLRIWF